EHRNGGIFCSVPANVISDWECLRKRVAAVNFAADGNGIIFEEEIPLRVETPSQCGDQSHRRCETPYTRSAADSLDRRGDTQACQNCDGREHQDEIMLTEKKSRTDRQE